MGKSSAMIMPYQLGTNGGSFQSVTGNAPVMNGSAAPMDDDPLLTLFHMKGCPFCKGLPGSNGTLANAAAGLIKYKQVERQNPIMDKLSKFFNKDVQVQGFPTIAIVTPSLFMVFTGGDRSMTAIQEWIKSVLSSMVHVSSDVN